MSSHENNGNMPMPVLLTPNALTLMQLVKLLHDPHIGGTGRSHLADAVRHLKTQAPPRQTKSGS